MPELHHSSDADVTPLRPVFTPTVERTRNFSVKPLPTGLRYGNFSSVRTLPHVGPGHVAGQHFVPYFNNQQLFRKVWEWFESWTPWQQKMLLCGLTNRSSTAMLESLVTILEPVFHRDFATSLRGTEPSSLLGMPRRSTKPLPKQPKYSRTTSRMSKMSTYSSVLSGMSSGKRNSTRSGRSRLGERPMSKASHRRRHPSDTSTKSLSKDELEIKVQVSNHIDGVTGDIRDTPGDTSTFTDKSCSMILTLTEAPDEDATYPPTDLDAFVDSLVAKVLADASKDYADYKQTHMIEQFGNLTDALGNLILRVPRALQATKEGGAIDTDLPETTPRRMKLLQEIAALDTWIPRKSAVETQHHNAWSSYGFQLAPTNVSLPTIHRHHSSFRGKQIKSADFFTTRPDMLQTELRTGHVKTPSRLTDIYVPAQKLYKNTHWYPERPQQGRVYVKPKRKALKQQFGEQIKQVWKWMDSWEDYERLNLLAEIVKLCTSEMINYLAQCLFHRLRERVDINWLPDRLLLCVFSYLPDEDIITSAQVCRRWRYLCAVDQLWMVKCHKLGDQKGITDMTDLVLKYNRDDQSIDWRLAYLELLRITDTVVTSERDKITASLIDAATLEEQRIRAKKSEKENNVEDIPKKGTGHMLARVSERLKKGISLRPVVDDSSETSDTVGSFVPCHMTEASDIRRSSLLSDLSSEKVASLEALDQDRPLLRRAVPAKKSSDICSTVETVLDYTENKIQTGPLTQWIRGQGPTQDGDEEDVALDVRPDLQQAIDILGNFETNNELHWKIDMEEEGRDGRMKSSRFAGVVPGIKRVRKFEGHLNAVTCVEFDKFRLFTGSMDRSIRIWDIRSGRSIHKLYGHKGGVRCLLIDKETLYSGSWDMTVMVWDVVHFLRKYILTGHIGSISCMKMDDSYLLSGSHDTTIRAWCRRSLQCMRVLSRHTSSVTCLSFDGTLVTSSGSDRTIRVTNLRTEECLIVITGLTETLQEIVVVGELVIGAGVGGRVFFCDVTTGSMEAVIQAHDRSINALDYHEGRFYTASSDMTVKEWDLLGMTCVRTLMGHKGVINDFKVSKDRMVSCSADGNVRVWDFISPAPKSGKGKKKDLAELIEPTVVHQAHLKQNHVA